MISSFFVFQIQKSRSFLNDFSLFKLTLIEIIFKNWLKIRGFPENIFPKMMISWISIFSSIKHPETLLVTNFGVVFVKIGDGNIGYENYTYLNFRDFGPAKDGPFMSM